LSVYLGEKKTQVKKNPGLFWGLNQLLV